MQNTITRIKVLLGGVGYPNYSGTATYINTNGHHVLVDTGALIFRKKLIENMAKIDVAPSDIDTVILTHMHIDHFSNLVLFQNADIYTTSAELKSYQSIVKRKEDYSKEYVLNYILKNPQWEKLFQGEMLEKQKIELYNSIENLSMEQYKKIVIMDEIDELYDTLQFITFTGHSADPRGVRFHYNGKWITVCGDAVSSKRWFERLVDTEYKNQEDAEYRNMKQNAQKAADYSDVIIPGHGLPFEVSTRKILKDWL